MTDDLVRALAHKLCDYHTGPSDFNSCCPEPDGQKRCQRNARTAIAECFKLRDMKDAPRDGTHIILSTRYGRVEAWFSPGYWTEETPSNAREYNGPVWVCADDKFQIEIEEGPSPDDDNHGEALGWMPLPGPPKENTP